MVAAASTIVVAVLSTVVVAALSAIVVAALSIAMVVAYDIRVIYQAAIEKRLDCLVGISGHTAIERDPCRTHSRLCTSADASADQGIHVIIL